MGFHGLSSLLRSSVNGQVDQTVGVTPFVVYSEKAASESWRERTVSAPSGVVLRTIPRDDLVEVGVQGDSSSGIHDR